MGRIAETVVHHRLDHGSAVINQEATLLSLLNHSNIFANGLWSGWMLLSGSDYRRRHCVMLQLDAAEVQKAQRIIDCLSGAVTALDGAVECIDARTFLFCPRGVAMSRC